jgi:hypothetical protein
MSPVRSKGRVTGPTPPPVPVNVRQAILCFDKIDAISDEMRAAVERNHPDLLWKLPPKQPAAKSIRRPRKRRATGKRA